MSRSTGFHFLVMYVRSLRLGNIEMCFYQFKTVPIEVRRFMPLGTLSGWRLAKSEGRCQALSGSFILGGMQPR